MVRFKNRYALCEILFPDNPHKPPKNIKNYQVYLAVKKALHSAHGDWGLGALQFSLSVKYLNLQTKIVIIRGERRFFDLLASSLVFITNIGNHTASLHTLHVGGSIRSCQKFLIQHHRRQLPLLYPQCTTEEERAEVMKSVMDACDKLDASSKFRSAMPVSAPSALQKLQEDENS